MKRSSAVATPASENRWTLAFAIVMLLLFALFLSLYSMAKKESLKLREEVEALRMEKPKAATAPVASANENPDSSSPVSETDIALQTEILDQAKHFLALNKRESRVGAKSDVEVVDLPGGGGFLVRIAAPDLFPAGSAKITPAVRPFVDRLGELILKSGRRLRIEGHADFDDSEAIQRKASPYANTWELAAARSAALAQYWMNRFDLDPLKIESAGYGKYRPLEKSEGRPAQANRRIEVVILRSDAAK